MDLLGEKEQKELEAAKAHASSNRRPFEAAVDCIDDRGVRAGRKRPGAHFGYVMIVLALKQVIKEKTGLDLTARMAVDSVKDTVEEAGEPFSMHTDKHADPEDGSSHAANGPLIGCGHINLAANVQYRQPYNVEPSDIIEAVNYARTLHENGEIELVNLDGEHNKEGAFLIVKGTKNTVVPNGYYVYDETKDKEFIRDVLIPGLARRGITGFNFEEFSQIDDRQRNMTASVLGEGFAFFETDVDGQTVQVEFIGRVPKI